MADLLALSFWQPWLWAVVEGHKGVTVDGRFYAIENRPWKPWPSVVGQRIALHASKTYDDDGADFIDQQIILGAEEARTGTWQESPPAASCVRGAIVGTALVAGAVRIVEKPLSPAEGGPARRSRAAQVPPVGKVSGALLEAVLRSPWAFGEWCWLLTDVRKLRTPYRVAGRQGLWRVEPGAAELLRRWEAELLLDDHDPNTWPAEQSIGDPRADGGEEPMRCGGSAADTLGHGSSPATKRDPDIAPTAKILHVPGGDT